MDIPGANCVEPHAIAQSRRDFLEKQTHTTCHKCPRLKALSKIERVKEKLSPTHCAKH